MGGRLCNSCVLVLWLVAAAQGYSQSVKFCISNTEKCEFVGIDEFEASPLCMPDADRQPVWLQPFVRDRLLIEFHNSVENPIGTTASYLNADNAPRVSVNEPLRGYCSIFEDVQDVLGPAAAVFAYFCQDCRSVRCERVPRQSYGKESGISYTVDLPRGGCFYVNKLPSSFAQAQANWMTVWDYPYIIAKVVIGLTLLWCATELAESTCVHAVLGGASSLILACALTLYWLFREIRGTVNNSVPFGGLLSTLAMTMLALVPMYRNAAVGLVVDGASVEWLSWRDPFYDLPIGWIVFGWHMALLLCIVAFGARMSVRCFEGLPEPTGEVDFYIASDGRRVDTSFIGIDGRRVDIVMPFAQRCLAWGFWTVGLALLLTGTHEDVVSAVFTFLILAAGRIRHFLWMLVASRNCRSPSEFRLLISRAAADAQTRDHTSAAILKLRNEVRAHPGSYARVSSSTELRLRRFADGGAHVQAPHEELHARSGRCAIL